MRTALVPLGLLLSSCALPEELKPYDFKFQGHVWSVRFYEGLWGNTPENPEPDVFYGTFTGMILIVETRDNLPLSKADEIEAKAVAAAYCERSGGKFDQSHSGSFTPFSKIWNFNGACSK